MIDLEKRLEINSYLYKHIHYRKKDPLRYRGIQLLKMPTDLSLYHMVIMDTKPDLIVEIGTRLGGSALYFQDQLDLVGNGGQVVTIDKLDQVIEKDERIRYLIGRSRADAILEAVKAAADGKRTMVVIDGDHGRVNVKWELKLYSPLVSPGCYMVVEDCYAQEGHLYQPGEARDWFLGINRHFEQTNLDHHFLVGYCIGGWLRRK